MLLCLRVRGVSNQRNALVDLYYSGVEWRGAADVEVEDLRASLITNEEQVLETFGNEQRVFVALALQ